MTSGLRRPGLAALALTLAALAASGCASLSGTSDSHGVFSANGAWADASGAAPSARPARSQQVRFVPETLILPGGASAAVDQTSTVDGVLQVPENVQRVGWWDGSAEPGDPFGATVIAGHVDSAKQGIGFFARLLRVRTGDALIVRGAGHAATYRVASVKLIAKQALVSDGYALDQTGTHRLVLITCAGAFRPADGGYHTNLVVVAAPVGGAR